MENIVVPSNHMLIDMWGFMDEKRLAYLKKTWPGLFQRDLLPLLPVEQLAAKFSKRHGRPTKELHTMLGVLLFQQIFDLTDLQTVETMAYDERWHFALNVFDERDCAKYLCERTLRNYRGKFLELDLSQELFTQLTKKLRGVFRVTTNLQRIDSTHIVSDMRRLSRIGLLVSVITDFLKKLGQKGIKRLDLVPVAVVTRYLDKAGKGCFGFPKPSESKQRLQQVCEDLLSLVEFFQDDPKVNRRESYQLLVRVLTEQCQVCSQEEKVTVEPKPPKSIRSDSLQNPSDPDATYDGHKGQGYQVQLMETVQPEREPGKPNLITYVQVEPAHCYDGDALQPALERTREQDLLPEQLLADTSYGSDANLQLATQMKVELIAPPSGTVSEERFGLEDFVIDVNSGEIQSCPCGEKPTATRVDLQTKLLKTIFIAIFNPETCQTCKCCNGCPKQFKREGAIVKYSDKGLRLAQRRKTTKTKEFREKYRWRAGIEGTNSQYKKQTGVGRLRVRTLPKVRFAAVLKALGVNIFRCERARKALFATFRSRPQLWRTWFTRLSQFPGCLVVTVAA